MGSPIASHISVEGDVVSINDGFNLLQFLHAIAIPYVELVPRTVPNNRDGRKTRENRDK